MLTEERIKMRMEELKDSLAYSEFYDEHGYFPDKHKRIQLSLSAKAIEKLSAVGNKSAFVNKLILS